jgi:hypothetical protein
MFNGDASEHTGKMAREPHTRVQQHSREPAVTPCPGCGEDILIEWVSDRRQWVFLVCARTWRQDATAAKGGA